MLDSGGPSELQTEDLGLIPTPFDFNWFFTQGFYHRHILQLNEGSIVIALLNKSIDDAINARSHLH